ncbi:MAG: Hsp70 family protein [Prochlorococcus sp.]
MDMPPEGAGKLQISPQQFGTLAIDLGSTTTVVAFQAEHAEKPQLLDLPPISRRCGEVPSLIWAYQAKDSNPLVGQQVHDADLAGQDHQNLSRDFKRSIGAPAPHRTSRDGSGLTPEQAGELLLQQIWQRLPPHIEVQRLVLTAPVESYRAYKLWLNQVCTTLPVDEIALVDEPTAAAMGAGLPPGSKLLVMDLGGCTIDLSLVALEGGEGRSGPIAQLVRFAGKDLQDSSKQTLRCARVLGKAGLKLGGRDLDHWIVNHLYPDVPLSEALLNSAERLKCRLSQDGLKDDQSQLEIAVEPGGNQILPLRLCRRELEQLLISRGLLNSLASLLERTLAKGKANGCDLKDLKGVVAVGGGAQIPLVRRWLQQQTQPAQLLTPPPIEAVAVGALQLTPGVKVRDLLHHGVSLRCWDQRSKRHHWHPLFVAGQPWPTTNPLELVLAASQVDQLQLEVVLGEPDSQESHEVIYIDGIPTLQASSAERRIDHWSDNCNPTSLALNPPGQPGQDCLKLQFSIDDNAQLQMEGIDLRSGERLNKQKLGSVR